MCMINKREVYQILHTKKKKIKRSAVEKSKETSLETDLATSNGIKFPAMFIPGSESHTPVHKL